MEPSRQQYEKHNRFHAFNLSAVGEQPPTGLQQTEGATAAHAAGKAGVWCASMQLSCCIRLHCGQSRG